MNIKDYASKKYWKDKKQYIETNSVWLDPLLVENKQRIKQKKVQMYTWIYYEDFGARWEVQFDIN